MSIYTCITLCKLGYFKMYRTYLCFQLTNKYLAHLFYTLPIIVFFVASQHTSTCFTMIKLASYMKQVLIVRVNHVHMTVTPFITLHFTTKPCGVALKSITMSCCNGPGGSMSLNRVWEWQRAKDKAEVVVRTRSSRKYLDLERARATNHRNVPLLRNSHFYICWIA